MPECLLMQSARSCQGRNLCCLLLQVAMLPLLHGVRGRRLQTGHSQPRTRPPCSSCMMSGRTPTLCLFRSMAGSWRSVPTLTPSLRLQ